MTIITPAHQQIIDGVEKNGVSTASYAPRTGENDPEEWFTYTIGVTKTAGWPEFIVAGLDQEKAVGLLGSAVTEVWERGGPMDGMSLNKVLAGKTARLVKRGDLKERHRKMADWYASEAGYKPQDALFQIIWPDRDGNFPGDPACSDEVARAQALDA